MQMITDANEDELIMMTMKPDNSKYEYPVVIIISMGSVDNNKMC